MTEEENILAVIPKNDTDRLQIAIKEYKGRKYLDMRAFFTTDGGENWIPTKKGITVYPDKLDVFKEAIEKAMDELKDE